METHIEKAKTYGTRARDFEQVGDDLNSYRCYVGALQQLEFARTWLAKDSPRLQMHLRSIMEPLMTRAEELHAKLGLGAPSSSSGPALMTAMTGDANAVSSEDKALQDALAGALVCDRPTVRLAHVAGLEDVKQALREAVIFPLQSPQLYASSGWAGILLYGPPGTGKTHIARAIAGESECTFFNVSAADLINKYLGQSERLVRTLFDMARRKRPSIIFIDEVESIVPVRGDKNGHLDGAVAEFLKQLDGLSQDANRGLLVLGATNLPWRIDAAALRRFERRIKVPLPDAAARSQMLAGALLKTDATVEQVIEMTARTEGYSGADIKVLLKEVDMRVLRQVTCEAQAYCRSPTEPDAYVPCAVDAPGAVISTYDRWPNKTALRALPAKAAYYFEALDVVKPSVSGEQLSLCDDWERQCKQ